MARHAWFRRGGLRHAGKGLRAFMVTMEGLEDRTLLSVSLLMPLLATSGQRAAITAPLNSRGGVTIHEQAGVAFTAVVGTFSTIAPGTNLHATINWGDGTTPSIGTITPTGVAGVDVINFQVSGGHTFTKAGTLPIVVTVTQSFGPPGSLTPVRLVAVIDSTAIVGKGVSTDLNGTITGKYSLAPTAVTLGALYIFSGTGTAGVMGPVSASGRVSLPTILAATGRATGTLKLTSISATPLPGGSVTLSLVGPITASTAPFPAVLNYVITGGTGAFAGATGTGTIDVTLNSGLGFTFVIQSS